MLTHCHIGVEPKADLMNTDNQYYRGAARTHHNARPQGCSFLELEELVCTKVYQTILGSTKVYQSLLRCTKVYQSILGCTKVYQSVLGYTKVYQSVLG